jgi:XTP/dITP diphosphohydrolase
MASGNRGKLREMARILSEFGLTVVPQAEFSVSEAEETGSTFVENALIKAQHAAAATGLPAIADDSGLAVDALQGRPGVYSARYAGASASDDDNIDKLLLELRDVEEPGRGATFHCVACFVTPGSAKALIAEGEWRGSIARQRRGENGFGYDPVFVDAELGLSAAELPATQKNQRSHRGKALVELSRMLRQQQ